MAKPKTNPNNNTHDPATAADVQVASTLIPSTRKERGWEASGTLIEMFANAKMQASILGIKPQLAALGIDVDDIVQTSQDAAALYPSLVRLDESAGRVHQRVTELNKRLLSAQTALLKAIDSAAAGSPIAKGLKGLASLRQKQVTATKAAKTKNKAAKKKKAAAATKAA